MKNVYGFLVLFLLLAHSSICFADANLDAGRKAFDARDYSKAKVILEPLALKGDPYSQYIMGTIYKDGLGALKDHTQALRWYKLAAENKNIEAQFWTGWLYGYSNKLKHDYPEALKWWEIAAQEGNCESQASLGYLHSKGYGTPKNNLEAYKWKTIALFCYQSQHGKQAFAEGLKVDLADRETKMTREELSAARAKVKEWLIHNSKK